jgi:hypothetical protein
VRATTPLLSLVLLATAACGGSAAVPRLEPADAGCSDAEDPIGFPIDGLEQPRVLPSLRGPKASLFAEKGERVVDTHLDRLRGLGSLGASWCAVGSRGRRQVVVVFGDHDGDGYADDFVGEREVRRAGCARAVAGDAKRGSIYVYLAGDRPAVVRLHDDDGDGVPDQERVFVDGAAAPALVDSGRTAWVQESDGTLVIETSQGCIVSEHDASTWIADRDGDGVPESVTKRGGIGDEGDAGPRGTR